MAKVPLFLTMFITGLVYPVVGTWVGYLKNNGGIPDRLTVFVPLCFELGFFTYMLLFPRIFKWIKRSNWHGLLLCCVWMGMTNLLVGLAPSFSVYWLFGLFVFGASVSGMVSFSENLGLILRRHFNMPNIVSHAHSYMFLGNIVFTILAWSFFEIGASDVFLFLAPFVLSLVNLALLRSSEVKDSVVNVVAEDNEKISNNSLFSMVPLTLILGGISLSLEVVLLNMTAFIFSHLNSQGVALVMGVYSFGGLMGRLLLPKISSFFVQRNPLIFFAMNFVLIGICCAVIQVYRWELIYLPLGFFVSMLLPALMNSLALDTRLETSRALSSFWAWSTGTLIVYLFSNAVLMNTFFMKPTTLGVFLSAVGLIFVFFAPKANQHFKIATL
jgi:hypothetical protein